MLQRILWSQYFSIRKQRTQLRKLCTYYRKRIEKLQKLLMDNGLCPDCGKDYTACAFRACYGLTERIAQEQSDE